MPPSRRTRDENFGEADPDLPQEIDVGDEDDELDTRPCPNCKQPVYEDADQCPHCKSWIGFEQASSRGRGPLYVVIVAVVILLCLAWLYYLPPH